jgi:hypothetical protein
MVAAFGGVAGTLKDLTLIQGDFEKVVDGGEAEGVLQQLGEATGKLRRLETLHLDIERQGLAYHRVAQGMAKGACPVLQSLTCTIKSGAAWLGARPSIILPSVQALHMTFDSTAGAEPLALAGALTVLDYRGSVVLKNVSEEGEQWDRIRDILKPRLSRLSFQ